MLPNQVDGCRRDRGLAPPRPAPGRPSEGSAVRMLAPRDAAALGVERQEAGCRALAEQLGWAIVAVHADNDLSAYSGKPRPGYEALLADLRAGTADAVICWHTDRLHRRPVELEDYIAVCEPRGVPTM